MRPGVRTGRYRLGKDDMIVDIVGNSHISVEDYAAAMIDELEYPETSSGEIYNWLLIKTMA